MDGAGLTNRCNLDCLNFEFIKETVIKDLKKRLDSAKREFEIIWLDGTYEVGEESTKVLLDAIPDIFVDDDINESSDDDFSKMRELWMSNHKKC